MLHVPGFVSPARACFCGGPADPCTQARQYDAVLVATIDRVEPTAPSAPRFPGDRPELVRAILADTTMVQGAVTPASVVTSANEASCGVTFRVGQRYLIMATRDTNGDLVTSLCDPTRLLEEVAPMVRHLQDVAAGRARGALVWGQVVTLDPPRPVIIGMPGVEVSLTGPETRVLTTDSEGRYVAAGLPPGTYRADARVPGPASPYLLRSPATATIESTASCTRMSLVFERLARIDGRVTGADGLPLADVYLELRRRDADEVIQGARTDADGRFSFLRLQGDTYTVAIGVTDTAPMHAPVGVRSHVVTVREGQIGNVTLSARPRPPGLR